MLGGFFALLVALLFPLIATASSYEAPLPAQLSTDPDLCAHAPCKDVIPDADSFSTRKGKPASPFKVI
jgi:NosR/NirI family nitrous oxide reductase transcriptional regulator